MESEKQQKFQVAVLGGGITGSAIFHTLSKYTDIDSVCLIEKCSKLGQINSRENNNSQTLHFGDIEANYSLEKATKTKEASEMVVSYLENLGEKGRDIYTKSHKILLAVGEKEVATLEGRYDEFKKLFPNFRKLDHNELEKVEPKITQGRKAGEKILACFSDDGYVVDFGKLADNLAESAKESCPEKSKIFLETEILGLERKNGGYEISTSKGFFFAQAVVVAMCSHSLMFAKKLGYGKEFSILPVGGNFYTTSRKVLHGKVYTMQNKKMPFAGVHGDPNIHNENETRFGPTSNVMPFLERNSLKTFSDFAKTSLTDIASVRSLFAVLSEKILFIFLVKSLIYEIPYLGPRAYAKLCRKIIPTLKYADFKNGKSKAGIRPQLIDNLNGKLMMGEVDITGENIIFHISPSPGATVCLKNAEKTAEKVIGFFNGKNIFYAEKFKKDFSNK